MSSINKPFLNGFAKVAGLPKWLHEAPEGKSKAKVKGQSKVGLKGLMKRRGVVVGGLLG